MKTIYKRTKNDGRDAIEDMQLKRWKRNKNTNEIMAKLQHETKKIEGLH